MVSAGGATFSQRDQEVESRALQTRVLFWVKSRSRIWCVNALINNEITHSAVISGVFYGDILVSFLKSFIFSFSMCGV